MRAWLEDALKVLAIAITLMLAAAALAVFTAHADTHWCHAGPGECVTAAPEPPPTLTELEALRIQALKFEALYLQRLADDVGRQLREAINAAATRAGVDPTTHRPDVGTKRWIRVDGPSAAKSP